MTVQIAIEFEQLVQLAKQLPETQWQKLKHEVEKRQADANKATDMEAFLLGAPTFTKKQLDEIAKTRKKNDSVADKIAMVDTSILIDLFRKTDKSNAALIALVKQGYVYCISAITEYEIHAGALLGQVDFWNNLLYKIQVLPFDKRVANVAVDINADLKRKRKQIAVPDLFIAATAVANDLPFATLNRKHFERISGLSIIDKTEV